MNSKVSQIGVQIKKISIADIFFMNDNEGHHMITFILQSAEL